jgi:hypothetical protein
MSWRATTTGRSSFDNFRQAVRGSRPERQPVAGSSREVPVARSEGVKLALLPITYLVVAPDGSIALS